MKYFESPDAAYIEKLHAALDYGEHNAMVQKTNALFDKGQADRMPMTVGINSRYLLLDPKFNKKKITYKEFTYDSRLMFEVLAEFNAFCNLYVPYFHEMGPGSPLSFGPDFQNFAEAAWFGAPLEFPENDVPAVHAFLNEDNKNMLFDKGFPEPFSGIYEVGFRHYENFLKYAEHYETEGCPVKEIWPTGLTTDGPFTLACEMCGTTEMCVRLYEDEAYAKQLLGYITDAVIQRIMAFRKVWGVPQKLESMFMADDSIALLSEEMYEEIVLPFHKKLVKELVTENGTLFIHLCGDATRHFPTIQRELRCNRFDTGFPVKHGELCKTLGLDTVIMGGPSVAFLQNHGEEEIEAEVKRIIEDVKPYTRRFMMREGNNIPPFMELDKVLAMYRAVLKYGKY